MQIKEVSNRYPNYFKVIVIFAHSLDYNEAIVDLGLNVPEKACFYIRTIEDALSKSDKLTAKVNLLYMMNVIIDNTHKKLISNREISMNQSIETKMQLKLIGKEYKKLLHEIVDNYF